MYISTRTKIFIILMVLATIMVIGYQIDAFDDACIRYNDC